MVLSRWTLVFAVGLLAPGNAATQSDSQAYCTYVMEQAQAQRDLLRTPTALAGFTQPETGLPMQVVGGATLGLADVKKAALTMDVGRKNCELYKTTADAQQAIQYAMPALEKEALTNRLILIDRAMQSLNTLMDKTSQMIEAQNATRPMLFNLQTTKNKLEADRADTQSKISGIYAPQLSEEPLDQLIAEKLSSETGEQTALDRLSRQNNWDVALAVGVHQQVNPVAHGAQPYGEVTVNYNLATHAINRHLDRAADAHDQWKKFQEGDVVRNMEVLHQQLLESISVQERRLQSLQQENSDMQKTFQVVANPDTSAALDFRNQLAAAQLLVEIESGDAGFRLDHLREYLAKNYPKN